MEVLLNPSWFKDLHNRPNSDVQCGYLPLTTELGYKFCTKCGWSNYNEVAQTEDHIIRGEN